MPKHYLKDYLPLIQDAFARGQSVTIPVSGISMQPTFSPGDGVTLSPMNGHTIKRGDVLLYERDKGKFVLHRVVCVNDNMLDFCGDAQTSIEKGVPVSSVIAFVSAYEKDGKTHNLQEIRLEGHSRLATRRLRAFKHKFDRFRREPHSGNSDALRFVFKYAKSHIGAVMVMCVFSMISALAGLGMAMTSGRIIDKALSGDMHHFREWFYLLFGLLLLSVVCGIVYSQVRVRASGKMRMRMREDLFSLLLSKSFQHLQKIHSGEILNRFTADIQVVVETATTLLPQLISIGTKLVGGLAFMLVVEPIFTGILILVSVVAAFILQLCSRYYKNIHKECQETEGKTRSFVQECVENLMVIKSFNSWDNIRQVLAERQEVNFKKTLRKNWYANIGNTAIFAGFTFAYYAGLAWGILRVAGVFGAEMSVGIFATFLQVMEQVRSPFRSASGVLPQFYSMCASAERLLELKRLPSEEIQALPVNADSLYEDMSAVCMDHVYFAYDRRTRVLEDASVHIPKGQFAVIVGGSGIGKSTIIKILLGVLHPQRGDVFIRTKHTTVPVSVSTRNMFAYVPQGNMVLSGTLRQNLTLGNDDVSEEDVQEAVRLACLTETVEALPQGLETSVGERGVGLSEGQIQRLAVARALISRSPILLLDECTSALDSETERRLLSNLRSIEGRTILFISHKEAVMRQADVLVEVRDRRFWIIQQGEYDDGSLV